MRPEYNPALTTCSPHQAHGDCGVRRRVLLRRRGHLQLFAGGFVTARPCLCSRAGFEREVRGWAGCVRTQSWSRDLLIPPAEASLYCLVRMITGSTRLCDSAAQNELLEFDRSCFFFPSPPLIKHRLKHCHVLRSDVWLPI